LIASGVVLRQFLLVHTFRYFVDDAYIFFRYARSASTGRGLVFNPGQRVMAFTSPLYTALMTSFGVLGGVGHLAGAADVLNLVLFVAASLLLADLARRGGARLWVILPAWVLVFPFVSGAVNGMETMLFVVLLLATLWLLVDGRLNLAVATLCLLILTRPEGALFAVAALAVVVWNGLPATRPVKGAIAGGAVLGGWALFAWRYYGTVVPQSIIAKSAVHGTSGSAVDKLAVLVVGFSTSQFSALGPRARDLAVGAGIAGGAFAVYGLVRDLRRRSPWAVVPAWFLLTWLFYTVTDPIQIWSWYSLPTALCIWWIFAREGPDLLARLVRRRADALAIGITVVVAATSFGLGARKRQDSLTQGVVALRSLGQTITRRFPGAKSVMLDDIGIVGWSTNLVVVDNAGLVSPLATERRGGRLLSLATLAERTAPDVICLRFDPATGAKVTDSLSRRPLFDSAEQETQLLSVYEEIPVRNSEYRTFLVKRSLDPTTTPAAAGA
jgi:hypothetical protein